MADVATSLVARRKSKRTGRDIQIGARVQLISGVLAGLVGIVVRCERRRNYVIGIPDASSGILARVPRRRFRRIDARAA